MSTQTHTAPPDDTDAHILLDADLAILGSSPIRYDSYRWAIRQEYVAVSDEVYKTGRLQIIDHFLDRDHIYYTESIRAEREEQARTNLAREKAQLVVM